MSEQRIEAGAAGAARDDEARADAAVSTEADTATAGEESVKSAYDAASGRGGEKDDVIETDGDSVPPEADRS